MDEYESALNEIRHLFKEELKATLPFLSDCSSAMSDGSLDHFHFEKLKKVTLNLTGSGKSYGYSCISDVAHVLLTLLKNDETSQDAGHKLHCSEQAKLGSLTSALIIVIEKIISGDIEVEQEATQNVVFTHDTAEEAPHLTVMRDNDSAEDEEEDDDLAGLMPSYIPMGNGVWLKVDI